MAKAPDTPEPAAGPLKGGLSASYRGDRPRTYLTKAQREAREAAKAEGLRRSEELRGRRAAARETLKDLEPLETTIERLAAMRQDRSDDR